MNILPEFESRQVLTSDELNWLTSYLDSQNRHSRRMLIGCGLIGGLQVKLLNNSIQISNGCAITSAGYVVQLHQTNEITTYTKVKKYTQNEKDKLAFPYLCDMDDLQQNYSKSVDTPSLYFPGFTDDVLELFEDNVNNVPLMNANSVNGKVMMLFAEIIQKELKDCEDDNCQERGKKYVFNTKVLLISQQDAIKLLRIQHSVASNNIDDIGKKAFPWLHLPGVNILKPVFSNLNNSFNEQIIAQEYVRCISDFQNNLPANVDEALNNLNNFCSIVKSSFSFTQQVKQFISYKITANTNKSPFVTQMVYDYLWKIVQSYHELHHEAQGLRAKSFIDESAFPNHVLLGLVETQNNDFANSVATSDKIFRHVFHSQFTQSEQAVLCKKITLMFIRLKSLLDGFDDSAIVNAEIRLTPGGHLFEPLSRQAIPYYLKPNIASVWNQFGPHLNLKQYTTNYYSIDESKLGSIVNKYNVQPSAFQGNAAFFRIEGVHNKIALNALNKVFQIRKKYGLAFEIIMLRLNDKAPFNHSFNYSVNEDIESMYQVVRAELLKQIKLNESYLDSLLLKTGQFSGIQKKLIAELERSYLYFLGTLNVSLSQPLALELKDAVIASNIATNNKAGIITNEIKFKELISTVAMANAENQPNAVVNNMQAASYQSQPMYLMPILTFPVYTLFINTFGSLISSVKKNDKFKQTTDISFYSHLLGITKSMQKNEKQELLFLLALQLYCALRLQEEYLTENFLEFDIDKYSKNLNEELLPACNAVISFLKKSHNDFVRNDSILSEVIKGEMLDYADRIKFDDDWIKIIQVDVENKKRNGGLGVENLMDRFVNLHPGIAHGCGVPNGGTYVMVYNQNNTITADFYLPYAISTHLRPIQFTLLENKTLTLSGKITANNKPVEASVKVGDALVFSNSDGFYNCLVSANTKLHIVCISAGFKTLEKDVEIKEISKTLDLVLDAEIITNTTTVKFKNQIGQEITGDIKLVEGNQAEIVAKSGTLSVTNVPNTEVKYVVKDENFEPLEFTVKITNENKGEVIQLLAVSFLSVKITDKTINKFVPELLTQIKFKEIPDKLLLSDVSNGIYTSETRIAIDKELTVQITYNQVFKDSKVSSGNAINEVVFEKIDVVGNRNILSWALMMYPATRVTIGSATRKIKSILLNETVVSIDKNTNLGKSIITYDGTLILDPIFINAPKIKVDNYKIIGSVIVFASSDLIANQIDIAITKSFFTFNKALNAAELRKILAETSINDAFRLIQQESDLRKENFYCLLFEPEQLKNLKTIFNV